MQIAIAAVLSFLMGSIPFSLIVARLAGGVDLRKQGSGNIGATNVARTLGMKWGLLAFLLDGLKGWGPVWGLPLLLHSDPSLGTHLRVLAGVSAVLGHMFPPWLGFKGGKGVATAFGVVLALAPQSSIVALLVFLIVVGVSRIVSLASICAVIAFAIVQVVIHGSNLWGSREWSLGLFSILVPLLIIIQHRSNIRRLLHGEEKQLSFSAKQATKPTSESKGNSDDSDSFRAT